MLLIISPATIKNRIRINTRARHPQVRFGVFGPVCSLAAFIAALACALRGRETEPLTAGLAVAGRTACAGTWLSGLVGGLLFKCKAAGVTVVPLKSNSST